MGDPAIAPSAPAIVYVSRVPEGDSQVVTAVFCEFCDGWLATHIADGTLESALRERSEGAQVHQLHEHLVRFGFTVELSNNHANTPARSADLDGDRWGGFTTRAVRMFAGHPRVASEPEQIVREVDGTALTVAIATKVQAWCRAGTVSPANYWELPSLRLHAGDLDAVGDDRNTGSGQQTALHDYIAQVQRDLAATGFAAHSDSLCEIQHLPPRTRLKTGFFFVAPAVDGAHPDRDLQDVKYLVEKFQRQSRWLWRMTTDGTHLSDVTSSDASYHAGEITGVVDSATAQVLHHWVDAGLHMVFKKFELETLRWPPGEAEIESGAGPARLRRDAADAWLAAATDVHSRGGTLEGPYASSPRRWTLGKMSSATANSAYSWHYSALAIDIAQRLRINGHRSHGRYGLEADGDRFRIWCRIDPQPDPPSDTPEESPDPWKRYCDGDAAPLRFLDSHAAEFAAPTGWYLDLSAILESHGMMRIHRHSDWLTNARAWEWWHYQYEPAPPPGDAPALGFGDYLQLFGVHEHRLRNAHDGWPAHEDIRHAPG